MEVIRRFRILTHEYIAFQKYTNNSTIKTLPGIIYVNGFHSEMQNSRKVTHLINYCKKNNLDFLTFDHYGHGLSSGSFTKDINNVTIGRWYNDLYNITKNETTNSQILIGSSMGFWLSLLIILRGEEQLKKRITGIIGIAPAINFTENILKEAKENGLFLDEQITPHDSFYHKPSKYSPTGTYPISFHFLQESRNHLIDLKGIRNKINIPIVLIHGKLDSDIPFEETLNMADTLKNVFSDNIEIILIKDGDHRLSREQDFNVLDEKIGKMTVGNL
ncbi:6154_t:CDS:1 [Funneliformis geosporum]|uniref:8368_t:CDS:1 n=1 Tax=Funneliformis geosporum TaxID=1117311 RepID=A0A9W4SUA3_9GLOM|nr:6154_t:CDS:1 [Funneliformis geosporum]CAI2180916.1 8368_t:CDS:1 [Funneliformis geosporum]